MNCNKQVKHEAYRIPVIWTNRYRREHQGGGGGEPEVVYKLFDFENYDIKTSYV